MKYYKRNLQGMNSLQIIQVEDDNTFYRIWNEENGAHVTHGFCPNEFKTDVKVPFGFYAKYGFKKYTPSEIELELMEIDKGDFTGSFY